MRALAALFCAMLAPTGAAADDGLMVAVGKALFEREWAPAPASTRTTDGLGPLYNARSCVACHPKGGRAPLALDDAGRPLRPGLVLRLPDHPTLGRQLQTSALPGQVLEGEVRVTFTDEPVPLSDGESAILRRPSYRVNAAAPLDRFSPRLAPSLKGIGLLARVPAEVVVARADPDDRDGDGIAGRLGTGRFGLRANHARLEDQVAEALSRDLGLSTPALPGPAGDCTSAQAGCLGAVHGDDEDAAGVEVGSEIVAALVAYVADLPPPRPKGDGAGRRVFEQMGCATCHTPTLPVVTAHGRGAIAAFTDLLLHDLGPALADIGGEDRLESRLWRTAPLLGVGEGATLLHDGRARSIEEAILWHDGEALAARERFRVSSNTEREALLAFLAGL